MIKWINKLVSKKPVTEKQARKMSAEERFIIANNPQNVNDVEYLSREFDRISYKRRSFSYTY